MTITDLMPYLWPVALAGGAAATNRTATDRTATNRTATDQAVIDQTVENLLGRMTTEEKVGQLNQRSAGNATGPAAQVSELSAMIAAGQVGSLLNVADAEQTNAYQALAVERSRLHIPLLFGLDVIHGFRTIFPINLGLAASWDVDLIAQTARLAASEAAREGVRWTFSPMVDIARDARWGRIAEGAGEDPYLGAAIAQAYVHGYQGRALADPDSVLACAKHFAGYGAAEAGRDYNTTDLSERTLRQVYLPPFRACVQAGVATVMAAFNALAGIPASANPFLLQQILRKTWGFGGFVVSDWNSIAETMAHGTAKTAADAAAQSLLAGVDMDLESGLYLAQLPLLVRAGKVPMARLDQAVGRVLREKVELGLFERPYVPAFTPIPDLPSVARRLARVAAEESFVLLQNRPRGAGRPLLPLPAQPGLRIGLIGPLADAPADMLGPWSARGRPSDVITLRTSLADRAATGHMAFRYAKGCDAVDEQPSDFRQALAVSRESDVVILALGERAYQTGEAASRAHLNLPGRQQQLLEAVAATGRPVVLLLFAGRPLAVAWAAQHIPTIVAAWFPGVEAGPALVRMLFGDVNPSGHLTATFPRSVGQEPLYYNALSTGRPLTGAGAGTETRFTSRYIDELNTPLFPFGHGLSYTTFNYAQPAAQPGAISVAALRRGAKVTVTTEVTNTGDREGVAVAQCYIRLTGTSVARPVRELKGFQRLDLRAGTHQVVRFALGQDELSFWNADMKQTVESAKLDIWIGGDSATGTPTTVLIHD